MTITTLKCESFATQWPSFVLMELKCQALHKIIPIMDNNSHGRTLPLFKEITGGTGQGDTHAVAFSIHVCWGALICY